MAVPSVLRSSWLKLIAVILLGAGAVIGLRAAGFDVMQMTPGRVRDVVLSFGLFAPLGYLAIYGQPLVPLPASIMMMTAGLAFGPLWGTLAALAGSMLRACGQFGLARVLGKDAIDTVLRGRAAAFQKILSEQAFQAVLLVRLTPLGLPFDVQNYGLGLSRVPARTYALATFLSLIPVCAVYVYLGYSLTDPTHVWKILLALVFVMAVVWLQRWYASRQRSATARGRG